MTRFPSQRPMRFALAVVLPLAAAGALAALFGLPGPYVSDLSESQVRHQLTSLGLRPRSLPAASPWRSEGIALSTLRSYQVQPGLELRLQRVQVWRRADFQLAYMTKPWNSQRRGLALGGARRLQPTPLGTDAVGVRTATVVRQSCLLPAAGGGFSVQAGVTAAELMAWVDQRAQAPGATLGRLTGVLPNRSWECLLLSLHSERSAKAESAAAALWSRLKPALANL